MCQQPVQRGRDGVLERHDAAGDAQRKYSSRAVMVVVVTTDASHHASPWTQLQISCHPELPIGAPAEENEAIEHEALQSLHLCEQHGSVSACSEQRHFSFLHV